MKKVFRRFRRLFRYERASVRTRRRVSCEHQGECHNLKEIYEQVNHRYFEGKLALNITWAGDRHSKPRRKVMFGSYNHTSQLIKIHKRLDQSHVPAYFVSFVVYHEMLHSVLPPIQKRGHRRRIHHPAFIEREKEFAEYALATAFEANSKKTWFKLL